MEARNADAGDGVLKGCSYSKFGHLEVLGERWCLRWIGVPEPIPAAPAVPAEESGGTGFRSLEFSGDEIDASGDESGVRGVPISVVDAVVDVPAVPGVAADGVSG